MGLFKTRAEKEIIAQMKREEQKEAFNNQLNELLEAKERYINTAVDAQINNNEAQYNSAVESIAFLEESIAILTKAKNDYDLANLQSFTVMAMSNAMTMLNSMANNKIFDVNIRKIQKQSAVVRTFMQKLKINQKSISRAMGMSNPASRTSRSPQQLEAIHTMINAEVTRKLGNTISGVDKVVSSNASVKDLSQEINIERNRII